MNHRFFEETIREVEVPGITAEAIVKDGDPRKINVKEMDHAPCSVEIEHRKEPKGND